MAAGDAVDPIRQDEAHSRGPGHPREEGGEAARPGVGMVQILEDEQDRPVLAGALEQPLDRLRPSAAASSATARCDSSRSRPTNRSLLNLAGMSPSCHTAPAA